MAGLASIGLSIEDLMAMANAEDADDPINIDDSRLSKGTIARQQDAWDSFSLYFEDRKRRNNINIIPGQPTCPEDVLSSSSPPLDYATFEAWIKFHAARAHVKGPGNLVSTVTLTNVFGDLRSYYKSRKGTDFEMDVRRGIRNLITSIMPSEGLATIETRPKTFTDEKGLRDIARAMLNQSLALEDKRTRLQVLLWMAMTEQLALRIGSIIPADQEREYAKFSMFTLNVFSNGTKTLLYRPPKGKTATGDHTEQVLVQMKDLYHCPVFLFEVIADMSHALPISFVQLNDPTFSFLQGRDQVHLTMNVDALDKPVFIGNRTNDPVIQGVIGDILARACRAAGFDFVLKPHGFRRIVVIFMRLRGGSLHA
jgi:hypothetical protein